MPSIASETGAVVMPAPAATMRRQRSSLSLRSEKRGRTPWRVKKRLVASSSSHERRAIIVSGVVTTILGFALKATMGWRISPEDEVRGIDLAEHSETAYENPTAAARLS